MTIWVVIKLKNNQNLWKATVMILIKTFCNITATNHTQNIGR